MICINGKFVDPTEARISVFDNACMMGIGCYETIRVANSKMWQLERHLKRFKKSAATLFLEIPADDFELSNWLHETVSRNNLTEARIRLMLTGGANSAYGGQNFSPSIIIIPADLPELPDYETGVLTMTYPAERVFPHVKSLNMLSSYEAYRVARENNVYETLFVNQHDEITEGAKTNVFFAREDRLITAPDNVLPGITREVVLELAVQDGITIDTRYVSTAEIGMMDECFISNALIGIAPVRRIDDIDFSVTSDSMTARLRTLFEKTR